MNSKPWCLSLEISIWPRLLNTTLDKYMKGSGIKDVLVETALFFGLKLVEAVLSGSHYERDLKGMQIIYDVL